MDHKKRVFIFFAMLLFQSTHPMLQSVKKNAFHYSKDIHDYLLKYFKTPLIKKGTVDRSIRIKVTNECPFACVFCHNEGTEMPNNNSKRISSFLDKSIAQFEPIENITVPSLTENSDEKNALLEQIIQMKELGFDSVHLTGGEPTMHPNLPDLIRIFLDNGITTKMTSNGQFSKQTLNKLVASGLEGINFSILALDPKIFLETQLHEFKSEKKALRYARKAIKTTTDNIKEAKKEGLSVKINVVILGKDFIDRVNHIVDFAIDNNIDIDLLPSALSPEPTAADKAEMELFAIQYALQRNATYIKTKYFINNSKGTHLFSLPNGTSLGIKFIREYQPAIICKSCEHFGKTSCTENFYNIRMEYRGGKPFVRLCVQKSTPQTLMPFETFLENKALIRLLTPGCKDQGDI